MTAETYTGPQGGDWFDPANWSNDTVPLAGIVADVSLSSDGTLGTIFTGVDATAGTVAGLTIDLSGTSGTPGPLYGNGAGVYYQFAPNLTAYTSGSSSAPVTLDVSAYGGSTSHAGLLIDRTAAFTATLSTLVSIPVTFDSSGGTLNLSFPSSQHTGTIGGFGPGDLLIASDEFSSTSYPFTTSHAGNVLTITPYERSPERFQFGGNYTLANFDIFYGDGGIEVEYQPCFATGTAIATQDGMRLVESLAPGDLVLLAEGGTDPIVWIGHRRQKGGTVVRIRAHALAPDSPTRDLLISEDHGLYLDGVLIQAGLLVNGETVRREPIDDVTFGMSSSTATPSSSPTALPPKAISTLATAVSSPIASSPMTPRSPLPTSRAPKWSSPVLVSTRSAPAYAG